MRLVSCVLVASVLSAFVGYANMYNDWTQKNAVNLKEISVQDNSSQAPQYGGCDILPQKDNRGNHIVLCDNPNKLQVATKDQPQYNLENEVEPCQYEIVVNGEKKYYLTNYNEGNADSVSSQCADTDKTLGIDGSRRGSPAHSHPIQVTKEGERLSSLWPSNADVLSSLLKGERVVRINAAQQNPKLKNAAILYDIYGRKCWELGEDGKYKREIMLTNYGEKNSDGKICWQLDKNDNACHRVENIPDPRAYQGDRESFYNTYGHNAFNPADTEKMIKYAEKFKANNETDDVKSAKPNMANPASEAVASSKVGVRGWCGCGDNHGKLYDVVDPFILMMCADKKDKSPEANKMLANLRYSYILCAKCGKCRRPSARSNAASWDQVNWRHELVICDNILELQLFRAKGLTSTQKMRLKLAPQEEFLKKIPDGGILFPGACACKVPDPVHVGPLFSDYEQYVCLICGHVRLPDATGNIPGGPTSLSSMGFDEQADAARKRLYQWLKNL